jgi:hypothetical protein
LKGIDFPAMDSAQYGHVSGFVAVMAHHRETLTKATYSISKSKRYLCWQRRRKSSRTYCTLRFPPPCRLNIIFDLEMELEVILDPEKEALSLLIDDSQKKEYQK